MPAPAPYEHKPRKLFRHPVDKWVVVGLAVVGIVVFLFWTHNLDQSQFWQGYYGEIRNPYPLRNVTDLTIEIDMRSATFGSLMNVNANIRVYPQDVTPEFLPNFYRIWFEESKSCLTNDPILVHRYSCYLDLQRSDQGIEIIYSGSENIIYTHGGDFTIFLEHNNSNPESRTTIGEPFIHISDAATSANYAFKFGAGLTGIAICVGFLNWYWRWREKHPAIS